MDQASRIIARLSTGDKSTGVAGVVTSERIACGAWKRAVGKRIAARTRALKLVRNTLVIEVDDELWRKNLWGLRYQILRNLQSAVGPEIVKEIELRIMPPRIESQRETGTGIFTDAIFTNSGDEADAIADPGLRRIYKAARKRETA